ncbi:unnamed protein product [Closterium sp. NIES-64]|nr:unnamed protein product [Closterium sp. NIES-64]
MKLITLPLPLSPHLPPTSPPPPPHLPPLPPTFLHLSLPAIAVHKSSRLDDSSAGSSAGGDRGSDAPPLPSVLQAVACVFDNHTQSFAATVVNPLLTTLSADSGWAPPAGQSWRNGNCRFLLSARCAVVRHFPGTE